MKLTVGLFLVVALATVARAQEAGGPQPPGLTVLGSSWSKSAQRLSLSPSETTGESFEEMRERVEREMRYEAAGNLPGGKPASGRPSVRPRTLPRAAEEGYRYRLSVKNTGAKTVRAVGWVYVFADPGTGKELARHRFHTRKRIAPGQSKELEEFRISPPSKVVSAAGLGRGKEGTFDERVVVTRVEYADGTVWQAR